MESNSSLVAACGLFCGACHRYIKGNCPGCRKNEKATWCKVRKCTTWHGYTTCAECTSYENVNDCSSFNTFFARVIALFFRSDRPASLRYLAKVGLEQYSQEMETFGQVVIKKGYKTPGS